MQSFINFFSSQTNNLQQHNDIDLKLVDSFVDEYQYLSVVLNMNYDTQWEVQKQTLKLTSSLECKLVSIYKNLTLSQYTYSAPLLASESRRAKKEMQTEQRRFPESHRHINRESSACAHHQARGGFCVNIV
jgi:hypothetical protein